MQLNFWALAVTILPLALLALILSSMAAARGLSRVPWALMGFVLLLNLIALVLLALKPKQVSPDVDPAL